LLNNIYFYKMRDEFFHFLAQTSDEPLALEFVSADGCWMQALDGKKYLDLISGISVSNLGHNPSFVVDAVISQAQSYDHLNVYGEYILSPQVKLATSLANILPKNLSKVYLVNSGAEAVEGAMKLSKRYTGRYKIIGFNNAYHGSTQGALSLMGNEERKRHFRPLIPNIFHIEMNNFDDLYMIDKYTAAVFMEPVMGEAGIILADYQFMKAVRQKCSEVGALLVLDEIQTGMGRTGTMFAFEQYDIVPDILLLAKAFGGGYPLGAFISSEDIMSSLSYNPPLGHITTFGGHPVSCAAALASLNYLIDSKIYLEVPEKEKFFIDKLTNAIPNLIIRHKGFLIGIELQSFDIVKKVIKGAINEGVIVDWYMFSSQTIRVAPPLIISYDELDFAADVLIRQLKNI
jgi:acetylornithine/succinyldiaminopimelate/putrescine aminotransferase